MISLNRLYASNLVNALGSWLTFLAIALITQERYGSQYVALVFLAQTLPAIFLSRSLARLIPVGRQEQVYALSQILLALNSLVLVFNQNLYVIFAHLLIASVLRSISTPLFNALVGKWVHADRQREVFTRLGGLQTGMLALAPIFGAWLKVLTSAQILFLVDSITFLIGIALMKELFARPSGECRWQFSWRDLFADIVPTPRGIPVTVSRSLRAWFTFLILGALLNAIEFPGFELHNLTEPQIGYVLAAWGAGSLFAFVIPMPSLSPTLSAALYVLALLAFVAGGHWVVLVVAFFPAGALSTYFSGALRAELQASVRPEDNPAILWGYANQVTQIINLIAYGTAGLLLAEAGFHTFAAVMLTCGVALVLVSHRRR